MSNVFITFSFLYLNDEWTAEREFSRLLFLV